MSGPQPAVPPQDRILVVPQVIRGTLRDLLLREAARVDKVIELARKYRAPVAQREERAALLRQLAEELSR